MKILKEGNGARLVIDRDEENGRCILVTYRQRIDSFGTHYWEEADTVYPKTSVLAQWLEELESAKEN